MVTTKKNSSNDLIELENHFRLYSLLLGKNYQINEDEQGEELQSLKNICHLEVFYFVVDIPSFSVTHCGGLDKWMGYVNTAFTLQEFYTNLHIALKDVHIIITKYLVEKACRGDISLDYLKSKFVIHHAMRHKQTGKYWHIKRIVTPFQVTEKKQVSAYLNRCTIIGPYNNEPLIFRMLELNPLWEAELRKLIKKSAPEILPFSEMEYTVLTEFARKPDITTEQVAAKLRIEKSTVNTYKNRLLIKAREYTHMPMRDVAACSRFFKDMGMV